MKRPPTPHPPPPPRPFFYPPFPHGDTGKLPLIDRTSEARCTPLFQSGRSRLGCLWAATTWYLGDATQPGQGVADRPEGSRWLGGQSTNGRRVSAAAYSRGWVGVFCIIVIIFIFYFFYFFLNHVNVSEAYEDRYDHVGAPRPAGSLLLPGPCLLRPCPCPCSSPSPFPFPFLLRLTSQMVCTVCVSRGSHHPLQCDDLSR